jgi:hypothetical protein
MTLKSTVLGLTLASAAMHLPEACPFAWSFGVGGAGKGIGWGFSVGSTVPAYPPPVVPAVVPVAVAAPVPVLPQPVVVVPIGMAAPMMPPPPAPLFAGPHWVPAPRGPRPHHIHVFHPCR